MIRILHVVSHMDRAGLETVLMRYYKYIDKSKIQFDFLVNKNKKGAYDDEILKMGGHIYKTCGLNPLYINKYKKQVKEILKNNPDIKIIHGQNDASQYPAIKAASEINFPIRISHSHNTSVDINLKYPLKMLYKMLIPKIANHYMGCGRDAIKYFFGKKVIKNNDYIIIKNAIEIDEFIYNEDIRQEIRQNLNINENTYLIGHVGRFSNQKNHKFIIKLTEKLSQTNLDFKIILIGEGELEEKIRRQINKKKLDKYFIFTGNISNVNIYYQALDLFILPSKYEGLPLVGIEAQASGTKCLFSEKITKEVKITDLVTFLPLNINIWKDRILKECKNITAKKDMTKKIKKAGYDIKTETKKLEELYISLIE